MHVLITGGAGFIGTRLGRLLLDSGHGVRVLDNLHPQVHGDPPEGVRLDPRSEFVRGDVGDRQVLEHALEGIECVVHLAAETGTAQSMYRIARCHAVNSQATALLLDILADRRHRVGRILLASSRAVYGEGQYADSDGKIVYPETRSADALSAGRWEIADEQGRPLLPLPTPETAPPRPASIYALTKWTQEELLRIACPTLGIAYTVLRLQNVYGEGQSLRNPYTGLLSIFATRVLRGEPVLLFEDGLMRRDFLHVDDAVRAFGIALGTEAARNRTFNVGSGIPITVRSAAEALGNALGRSVPLQVTGRFRWGDVRHCCADISAIRATLGFVPEISLPAGIERLARWVEAQPLPSGHFEAADWELRSRGLSP